MTRMIVAYEGIATSDGRFILPGALTSRASKIPVGLKDINTLIGMAKDFERNPETGEISYDITTKEKVDYDVNSPTIYVLDIKTVDSVDTMTISSGKIAAIVLSEGPSLWPVANRSA